MVSRYSSGSFNLLFYFSGWVVEIYKCLVEILKLLVSVSGVRADAVVSKGLAIDDGSCGVFWMGAGCM